MAVGSYRGSDSGIPVFDPLVERWDGTAWSVLPSPGGPGELAGVSCPSSTYCMAVGSVAEQWDGVSWSVTQPGVSGPLSAVSCTGPASCVAVGYELGSGTSHTLVETWNGTTWSATASPDPDPNEYNSLVGVSCASSTSCVAIGHYGAYNSSTPFIETWDGTTWSLTPTPGLGAGALNAVSCASPTTCVAVGQQGSAVLIETWDGTTWSDVPFTNFGTLTAVSCLTSTDCVAVGILTGGLIVETWDGTAWTLSFAPSPGRKSNLLDGVSCATPTYCAAVGEYANLDVGQFAQSDTLIETPWMITTASLPTATVGQAYSATLTASGGNVPYRWTVVGSVKLPKGLTLDKLTGVLSGTPTRSGTFALTVRVQDARGTPPHPRGSTTALLVLTVS